LLNDVVEVRIGTTQDADRDAGDRGRQVAEQSLDRGQVPGRRALGQVAGEQGRGL